MSKLAISTVVSPKNYSYYIPSFLVSVKRAYPDAKVVIFVKGKLDSIIREFLSRLRLPNWQVYEDAFAEYPNAVSMCNSLRHVLPEDVFEDCDYLWITDIDFIMFPHEPTLLKYFKGILKRCGQPYAAHRGPYMHPRQPEITKQGWRGDFVRMASGTVMLKIPEWFNITREQREYYADLLRKQEHDRYDKHLPASYREYDEVMLYRICKDAGLGVPTKKAKYYNGEGFKGLYRDIHLGDFKFAKRWTDMEKMRNKIKDENIQNFVKLETEELWKEAVKVCCKNEVVRRMIHNVRKHVKKRLK